MAQIVALNLWWPELWGSGLEPDVFPSSSVSGTDTETVNPLSWRAAWVSLWALQPDSAEFSTEPAEFSNLAYHIFLRLLEVHFLHIFQSGVLMAHSSSHCKGKLPFFFYSSVEKKLKQAVFKCTSSYVPQMTLLVICLICFNWLASVLLTSTCTFFLHKPALQKHIASLMEDKFKLGFSWVSMKFHLEVIQRGEKHDVHS